MWEVTETEAMNLITINNDLMTPERIEHYKVLAPIYLEVACDYCHTKLDYKNKSVQLFIAKAIQYYSQNVGLTSRSMGTVSYSFESNLPESVLRVIKPFKKVAW